MRWIALVCALVTALTVQERNSPVDRDGGWPWFGRDPGASRFSPLTQIDRGNVDRLTPAWTFDTGVVSRESVPGEPTTRINLQVTPIVAGGMMYVTGGNSVFALEPETGALIWRWNSPSTVSRRGVAYWPGNGSLAPRVYSAAGDGRMVAIDARTGQIAAGFGVSGFVDLRQGIRGDADGPFMLITPPVVHGDILITGGRNTEGEPATGLYGDIRGWDARSGSLLWSFHTVPRSGEPGVDSWENDSWKNRSGANAWTYMTVDVERGLVFAATGSPTADFYGGDRKGKNVFANSVVALDAKTGVLKWFQQLVHHDIWDWDLPAAPTLIDVTKNGRRIPAVAQITKMSTLFIFDRVTGQPLFGMEERSVPQSDVPGEATWPTQPFPLQPPPLARTAFDPAKDFYSLTPEHAKYCRDLWNSNRMFTKGIFTPPALERTMVMFPSTLGGGNWGGLSYDAARALVFTNIMNLGQVARLERRTAIAPIDRRTGARRRGAPRMAGSGIRKRRCRARRRRSASCSPSTSTGQGSCGALPLGTFDDLKARGFGNTGTPNIGGSIATAGGLVFVGATIDRRFRAFDAGTGRLLWETKLDASAHATPMTFMGRDSRQYVVVAAGGGGLLQSPPGSTIVAFALPANRPQSR